MNITMQSAYSGKTHTLDLPITEEQWKEWNSPNRRKVQEIFPRLSADEREFLLTGITPIEWEKLF